MFKPGLSPIPEVPLPSQDHYSPVDIKEDVQAVECVGSHPACLPTEKTLTTLPGLSYFPEQALLLEKMPHDASPTFYIDGGELCHMKRSIDNDSEPSATSSCHERPSKVPRLNEHVEERPGYKYREMSPESRRVAFDLHEYLDSEDNIAKLEEEASSSTQTHLQSPFQTPISHPPGLFSEKSIKLEVPVEGLEGTPLLINVGIMMELENMDEAAHSLVSVKLGEMLNEFKDSIRLAVPQLLDVVSVPSSAMLSILSSSGSDTECSEESACEYCSQYFADQPESVARSGPGSTEIVAERMTPFGKEYRVTSDCWIREQKMIEGQQAIREWEALQVGDYY